MTPQTLFSLSELIQSLIVPFLAMMLAWQANFMRMLARQNFETRLELETLKRAMGVKIGVSRS